MYWLDMKSLEELMSCGKLKELTMQIRLEVGEGFKFRCNSWKNLYEDVSVYQEHIRKSKELDKKQPKNEDTEASSTVSKKTKRRPKKYESNYFKSKDAEIIYYLLELEGSFRLEKLGVNKSHYSNKIKATTWRNELVKIIHPDKCKHPLANEAMAKLISMYENMVRNE